MRRIEDYACEVLMLPSLHKMFSVPQISIIAQISSAHSLHFNVHPQPEYENEQGQAVEDAVSQASTMTGPGVPTVTISTTVTSPTVLLSSLVPSQALPPV